MCGTQKGKGDPDRLNALRTFEKLRCLTASWGSQNPMEQWALELSLPAEFVLREVEFREFQCVRIFTRETGSKGLEVAQLPDRRYR